jgi:hypothetical protein
MRRMPDEGITPMIDEIANRGSLAVDLWNRVQGEYREMPGLQLTLVQASRLWNTNLTVSQEVLDALVEAAFLCRRGAHYVRADSGRLFI